ncbi:acyl-CoA N-acyltransferase [Syncephalis plumigaleata]|nr:acyl-CoA N-acyltransferase [Syncephalis plumigaleata]
MNNGVAHPVSGNGYGHYHDDPSRQQEEEEADDDDDDDDDDSEHPTTSNVRNIEQVIFGSYLIDTWYYSPYAEEYGRLQRLYVCELCFKYMKRPISYIRHQNECGMRQPPGQLIYKNGNIKVYEVDGHHDKLYCQNLCLFAKFFLDQKTVFYDVAPFLFYVMTMTSSEKGHSVQRVVAYFSKEKQSIENYNLACITTFPPYQKKGFGRFLIELSYELSKLERTVGHPEKPLSDLGLRGYESFWITAILRTLLEWKMDDLSEHDADNDTNHTTASSMEVDDPHIDKHEKYAQ